MGGGGGGGGGGAWGKLPPLPPPKDFATAPQLFSRPLFMLLYRCCFFFCTTPRKIYLSKKWGFYRSLHHFQKPSCSAQKGEYFPPPCKAMWFIVIAQIFPPPPSLTKNIFLDRTLYVHAWVESLHNLTQVFVHPLPMGVMCQSRGRPGWNFRLGELVLATCNTVIH